MCSYRFEPYQLKLKIVSFLIFVMFSLDIDANVCRFKMGWEHWRPYMYHGQSGKPVGSDIEIVKLAMEMIDCRLELLELPWRRVLKDAERGELNLVSGAAKSAEREVWGNFSIPYRSEVMRLFVLKGNSSKYQFNTVDDLQDGDFQLAIIRGSYYGEAFSRLARKRQFQRQIAQVLSAEQMIKMLTAGRIQGFIGDSVFINREMSRLGVSEKIEIYPLVIANTDLHFIFSKKSTTKKQLERFNQALKVIKNSGKLKEIVDKYHSR